MAAFLSLHLLAAVSEARATEIRSAPPFLTETASVDTIAPAADGGWYIGGRFSSVAGQPQTNLAKLRPDGALDTAFRPHLAYPVLRARPDSKSRVIVYQSFSVGAPDAPEHDLLRLTPSGETDTTFTSGLPLSSIRFETITVDPKDRVMLLADEGEPKLFRLLESGAIDESWNPPLGISSFAVSPTGNVYVKQARAGDKAAILRLDENGAILAALGLEKPAWFELVSAQDDGRVWIERSSNFPDSGEHVLERLNASGQAEAELPLLPYYDRIAVDPEGVPWVSGLVNPTSPGNLNTLSIRSPGRKEILFASDAFPYGSNDALLAIQQDHSLLLFYRAVNIPTLFKLDEQGKMEFETPVLEFAPTGSVHFGFDPNAGVLASGYFDRVGETPRFRLARLNPDLTLNTGFDPGYVATNFINGAAAKLLSNGEVVVVSPIRPTNWIKLSSSGAVDSAFHAPVSSVTTNFNSDPLILQQADGKLIFLGSLAGTNAADKLALRRLNADGSIDPSFQPWFINPAAHFNGPPISQIASGPDKQIYFLQNAPSNSIVRLNTDGTLDPTFIARVSPFSNWLGITPNFLFLDDGKIVAYSPTLLLRFDADGSPDPSFHPPVTSSTGAAAFPVGSLMVSSPNSVYRGLLLLDPNGNIRKTIPAQASILGLTADGTLLYAALNRSGVFGVRLGEPEAPILGIRSVSPGSVDISFLAEPGRAYTLLSTADFLIWTPTRRVLVSNGQTLPVVIHMAASDPQTFYYLRPE